MSVLEKRTTEPRRDAAIGHCEHACQRRTQDSPRRVVRASCFITLIAQGKQDEDWATIARLAAENAGLKSIG